MDGGLLSLRWNDHGQTFFSMLSSARKRDVYTDVTLACDGRFYPAHRLVLSTCSDFFDQMFQHTSCKHPVVVVANMTHNDLEALLNYMYLGEINVLQSDLSTLMKAAESLRIKGLAEPTSSTVPDSESKDTKRLHEVESTGNKRKKVEDSTSTRKRLSSEPETTCILPEPVPASRVLPEPVLTSRVLPEPVPTSRVLPDPVPTTSRVLPEIVSCVPAEPVLPASSKTKAANIEGWSRSKGGMRPDESANDQSSVNENLAAELVETEMELNDDCSSPEVKVEEVSVKDEPTSWYSENDSELPTTNTTASLESSRGQREAAAAGASTSTVGYQGEGSSVSGAMWGMLQSQVESHLLHGLPGTSALAGVHDDYGMEKKHLGGRRKKLTQKERQELFTIARANPEYSSEVLRNIIISKFDLNISSRTIRRELIHAGLKTMRPRSTNVFPYGSMNSFMEMQEGSGMALDPGIPPPTDSSS